MPQKPVVVLLAGREISLSSSKENQDSLDMCMAAVRAVLERGGRVLLCAEAAHVIPLLMTAAEYLTARSLEGSDILLSPVIAGTIFATEEGLEKQLLQHNSERSESDNGQSLLDEMKQIGLVDADWTWQTRPDEIEGPFVDLLRRHKPIGIIVAGASPWSAELLGAAELYHSDINSGVHLLQAGMQRHSESWQTAEQSLSFENEMPPPMWDGENILDTSEGFREKSFIDLAQRAAAEALLALQIDHTIKSMFLSGQA